MQQRRIFHTLPQLCDQESKTLPNHHVARNCHHVPDPILFRENSPPGLGRWLVVLSWVGFVDALSSPSVTNRRPETNSTYWEIVRHSLWWVWSVGCLWFSWLAKNNHNHVENTYRLKLLLDNNGFSYHLDNFRVRSFLEERSMGNS